jgi:DNA-binding CsgD family transcriptional regulator/sugar-specific transcriptional regulator TrmB
MSGSSAPTVRLVLGKHIPPLVRLGATPDADLVYRTLASFGDRTAGGLARDLGIASRRVNDALEALASVGAAVEHPRGRGVSPVWRAADPQRVIGALAAARRRAARHARDGSGASQRLVDGAATALGSGVRHLHTREATRQRLAELVAAARHSHLTMNPETRFDAAATTAAAPMDRSLADRGLKVRILGVQPIDLAAGTPAAERNDSFAYREAARVPMKLIVVDRAVALFPVDPHDYDRGYLEICQSPVVESLAATFEQHWTTAWDSPGCLMPMISVSDREQALIDLLSAGHTDASAARELRISERSVTTMVRSLMDRLAVDNRFQLGVALGTLRVAVVPASASRREQS